VLALGGTAGEVMRRSMLLEKCEPGDIFEPVAKLESRHLLLVAKAARTVAIFNLGLS